jgi:hypothetical protein
VERGTFPFAGRGGDDRGALYGERYGFSGLAEGMRPGKGDLSYGAGWKGRAGGAGRRGYGHWLVKVPPELVLEVGEAMVPPLPMEEVGLPRVPPDPTWEVVWPKAQQAWPFLSSLTT